MAFVFASAPHGSSSGREGLDALLATSALSEDIGVFFLGDGVLQLLPGQQPKRILGRNYIATFRVLSLYDIDRCWICARSLRERGIAENTSFIVDAGLIEPEILRLQLKDFDIVLTF